ncbi:MAG TPA: hypothetical protein VG929_06375 [Actinomycetota bacterium]|nr:hypothetical protein [Actinomycetota bacterium]
MPADRDEKHPTPTTDPEPGETSDEEDDGTTVEEESEQSFPASDPPPY